MTAWNEAGEAVGNAWVGPDPAQAAGNVSAGWLYDVNVFAPFQRRGYGTAILAAAEALIVDQGWTALGLSVVGDNAAAIALYRRAGYEVASMSMRKTVSGV